MKRSALFLVIVLISLFTACKKNNSTGSEPDPDPIGNTGSTVPYISINTNGTEIPDEPKINASMRIITENIQVFSGDIGIEVRGSTSRRLFDKLSYGFETWDTNGDDIDVTINGLPEEEDWILYGPFSDKTLVRNKLAYDLAREIGEYASRGFFAELEINDEYQGVYILMEKIKRDNNRLDLANLRPSENEGADLTGGYILKIDKTSGDTDNEDWGGDEEYTADLGFRSDYGAFWNDLTYAPYGPKQGEETYYLYEDPDAAEITPQQKAYIQQYIDGFETAIFSDDYYSAYQNYINIDSFVDHFLLNELSGNPDAYRLSTYLHKDKDGKLNMGPVWDFNIAFGNDGRSATNSWIYLYNENYPQDLWLVPFYWEKLLQDATFQQAVQSRWNELKNSTFSESNIHSMIDGYIAELEAGDAINRNYEKWDVLGVELIFNSFVGETYQDEIDYLKGWISDRISWMDQQI
jgi:hypothetical protein